MKGLVTIIFSTCFLVISVSSACAVDGFNVFKWDMSLSEVRKEIDKERFCTVKDLGVDSDGVHTLACDDFPFAGDKRFGFFLFINEKLLRIGMVIDKKDLMPLIDIFDEQNKRHTGTFPARGDVPESTMGWDRDTILLKVARPREAQIQQRAGIEEQLIVTLIYTSAEFETRLLENRKKALRNSIRQKR